MKPAETPGERMAEVRTRMGWSQTELAKEAGISRATVSRLECNQLSPDNPNMQRCLQAMKLSPEAVEIIMNPQATMTASGWKDPSDPEVMEQMQKELDMLMHQYPLMDNFSRSIIMSVVWLEMRRRNGREYDLTALMAPLVQEWSNRILDLMKETSGRPAPDWMDAVRLANQATKPDASNE